ncbi:YeeE/YedE family protein [Planctobacterium marinum]
MTEFTPYAALAGGVLIGLAGVLFLLANGKVMGVSGLLGQLMNAPKNALPAVYFMLGLLLGPAVINAFQIDVIQIKLPSEINLDWWQVVIGAVLVGLGTRMGSGCTSGHGVCGIGRFSLRSIVATCVFMGIAILVVTLMRHVLS